MMSGPPVECCARYPSRAADGYTTVDWRRSRAEDVAFFVLHENAAIRDPLLMWCPQSSHESAQPSESKASPYRRSKSTRRYLTVSVQASHTANVFFGFIQGTHTVILLVVFLTLRVYHVLMEVHALAAAGDASQSRTEGAVPVSSSALLLQVVFKRLGIARRMTKYASG